MHVSYIKKEKKARLKVETPEDLWHLSKVLEKGDLITAKTLRKKTIRRGKEIVEGKREAMTLQIELEKTEYRKETHSLKLLGKITLGPEDVKLGSHHSIYVEPGLLLIVQKDWKNYQLDKLRKAGVKKTLVFVCTIDRDGADFAILKDNGIEFHGKKSFKKRSREEEKRDEFYNEIISIMKDQKTIIIAGPGFEKENLYKYIKEKEPELAKRCFTENASERGRSGIREVLRKSGNKILKESRIAEETILVDNFFKELEKEGLIVYGKKETEKALEMGALKELLVSDDKINEFENILNKAEKMQTKIHIISAEHDTGEQFLGFGGIGGFLRFKL
ncbi:MAG: mRNA surveillance protein pelota [Candidatus Aenigmarchaeota archaeon]|nr:mRNA surveillance protein pelota [Candidatus Aenigmarchaeota archaeon]